MKIYYCGDTAITFIDRCDPKTMQELCKLGWACAEPNPIECLICPGKNKCWKYAEEQDEKVVLQRKGDKMQVTFVVEGTPRGKQRPRFSMKGGIIKTYTPKQTVDYEKSVRESYKNEAKGVKLNGNITARIVGCFPIPKSWSARKREQYSHEFTPYPHKVDCDNLAKIILDSLNGVAFDDDAQVTDLRVIKKYNVYPRVEVTLTSDDEIDNLDK